MKSRLGMKPLSMPENGWINNEFKKNITFMKLSSNKLESFFILEVKILIFINSIKSFISKDQKLKIYYYEL